MAHGKWSEVEARGVLDAWKRSGLSLERFAKQRGIVSQRLRWWLAKFRKAASDLYIVEGTWLWSFVMTHEEAGMGIGPFFVTRLAPPGQ